MTLFRRARRRTIKLVTTSIKSTTTMITTNIKLVTTTIRQHIQIVMDAKNLLSALRVTNLKISAEKNFIVHLMWLKDKITSGVVRRLIWTDTRDMTADGHTKGSIKRTALHQLMNRRPMCL